MIDRMPQTVSNKTVMSVWGQQLSVLNNIHLIARLRFVQLLKIEIKRRTLQGTLDKNAIN